MLYLVSTPIGNLRDMTLRALEVLKEVDLIAAEDTRHTRILLDHYDIKTLVTSYFEHNEEKKTIELLQYLKEGKTIALVSDAGTPGISDPGYPLIRAVKSQGIPLTVVPGPTALIAALSISGLPAHSFIFEGFLPVRGSARRKKLESLKNEVRTLIFYESPHRLVKTLSDMKEIWNDPVVVCVRELTKKFEEVRTAKASDLLEHFTRQSPRGEFVLLVSLRSLGMKRLERS